MGSVSLTGNDTIIVNDRILKDFGDGDNGVLAYPNNLVEVKTGKNGNTIYALNQQGNNATLTLRILTGSADDKFLNSQIALYKQDPPSFPLLAGELVKRSGDGAGNVSNTTYKAEGGVVQKIPDVKENVEGDTEQAVSVYVIVYANAGNRAIA